MDVDLSVMANELRIYYSNLYGETAVAIGLGSDCLYVYEHRKSIPHDLPRFITDAGVKVEFRYVGKVMAP